MAIEKDLTRIAVALERIADFTDELTGLLPNPTALQDGAPAIPVESLHGTPAPTVAEVNDALRDHAAKHPQGRDRTVEILGAYDAPSRLTPDRRRELVQDLQGDVG